MADFKHSAEALDRAAKAVGGKASLADRLGIRRQSIHEWKRVPAERVLTVEHLTGIPRYELRPDLYPRGAV